MAADIAFVAYETPSAPCGGAAAVMGRLPAAVRQETTGHVVGITPFHRRITPANHEKRGVGALEVIDRWMLHRFQGEDVAITLLRCPGERPGDRCSGDVPWYYVRAEHAEDSVAPPFFNGKRHPYDLSARDLRRDAFLFGRAVAEALARLEESAEHGWTLLLQDWEAATAALVLGDRSHHSHRLFLTLNNSLDSAVAATELASFGVPPAITDAPGDPVLVRALRVVEPPVATVSEQFARDLTEDTLQCEVMAPHLQRVGGWPLSTRLVGIDNGPFQDLSPNVETLRKTSRDHATALIAWKAAQRQAALEALRKHQPSDEEPVWGDIDRFAGNDRDSAVWFVMAGRDDPGQKGYDIATAAVERFLFQKGNARFLFFPIPGDEGLERLSSLRLLAQADPQHVIALPFLWKAGYNAALQGAAYGLMPSRYEPFGGANEFYLNGTLGIARATGGLLQQIIPLRIARSFSPSVKRRAEQWHASSAPPTGILFRERDDLATAGNWRALDGASAGRGSPLFGSMVDELLLSIKDGVELFEAEPERYAKMLMAGIQHIEQSFSWKRAAAAYVRIVSR